ncbi:GLPGLI family protein [Chryseolinea lacunae]|uniref:GLPGLI family protein n=1 Tax=Chryseolinea lacunae TaxID=2801331 RepID=A0ABS1KUU2_9BACT|nr:GLPGLI family protein [Chryseolinea lacunae]MBL0742086.1 GLPGLI family protein [Chryseolinea lacunae]
MKRILLLLGVLAMLAAVHMVVGQVGEGVITYEVKTSMHRRLPPDRQEMKDQLPEFNIVKDQLFFNTTESLYAPVEEDDEEEFGNDRGPVRMRFARPNARIYTHRGTGRRVVSQEFMGKRYRIDDTVKISPWKFGTETKTIQGYSCKRASFYNEERKQNVVAWYTGQLRASMGPENFNTLPGTILQVDINDGERIITAEKIEMRALKKNELKVPTDGQNITQAEFTKMMAAQIERMRANGGNMMIRN